MHAGKIMGDVIVGVVVSPRALEASLNCGVLEREGTRMALDVC